MLIMYDAGWPTSNLSSLGMDLRTIGRINRPLSSFKALERHSSLSAHTTWENSSTLPTFTLFPKLSSFNTVAASDACCSSTVFFVINFSGYLFSNAIRKFAYVFFSPASNPFHYIFAALPDFNHNSKVRTFSALESSIFQGSYARHH